MTPFETFVRYLTNFHIGRIKHYIKYILSYPSKDFIPQLPQRAAKKCHFLYGVCLREYGERRKFSGEVYNYSGYVGFYAG